MKVLVFNPQLCDGCRVCEETCSQTWFKEVNAEKSAIRISASEDQPGRYQATVCNQCGECIDICPVLALTRDRHGIVRINKKLCTGCLSCVGFCPILAMYIHPDYVVPFKCIACGECAKACPTGALSIEDLPEAPLTETEKRMKVVAS
ncbi:MAG: 4Fe-4S binding protein [Chloroflexi bacterium]|nr:4Fe-4S binding protein [Chloroflexota bacterium]